LKSIGWKIDAVYGSPEANETTGELLKVNTLFPSPSNTEGETKGGVILVELSHDNLLVPKEITFHIQYEDRYQKQNTISITTSVPEEFLKPNTDFYPNTGIRKAICLSRYVSVLRQWIIDERKTKQENKPISNLNKNTGMIVITKEHDLPHQPYLLSLLNNYRSIIELVRDYLYKETENIPEPELKKEIEALEQILNCKEVPLDLYIEKQIDSNSCFLHAINAYFQKKYIDNIQNFLNEYSTLLIKHQDLIHKILNKNCNYSFYGNNPVPQKTEDDISDPSKNEDLKGHWEVYKGITCESFIAAIRENQLRELSPAQVLFMLEFQFTQNSPDNSSLTLTYTPHRFYHRYARSPIQNDRTVSSARFTELLTVPEHKNAKPIFLCHNQTGLAHAFAAYRVDESSWALLDSLIGCTKSVKSEELWTKYENAERASVMCIQDFSRITQLLQ